MASRTTIDFNHDGLAECLRAYEGDVNAAAEKIAARATGLLRGNGSGFHVELTYEPRFQDKGTTRPIARIISNDEATAKEEAEYKILSKAVTG